MSDNFQAPIFCQLQIVRYLAGGERGQGATKGINSFVECGQICYCHDPRVTLIVLREVTLRLRG